MQETPHGPDLAYSASLALRIGGAVFVACPDERLQAVYYRVDAGVRAVWRHLRGSEINQELLRSAEQANHELVRRASALTVPEEFVTGFRDLAAASLGQLARGEAVSRDELSSRAVEVAGFLESGLQSAAGAVDFERSCQASCESLLGSWADDPLSTMRRVRRETDVWALSYQRFVRPEVSSQPG
ncbi:hypothetical protein [Streptomyces sp. NPDC088254]|uniref:hypothetical protein n=1 Tax=Streptomyces sp. NPDC088254 TaxID=3365847 RepID=UPI003824BF2F